MCFCLSADPANRVRFPKPAKYAAARFEVMRRFVKSGEKGKIGKAIS
jgi:hypothetical protein